MRLTAILLTLTVAQPVAADEIVRLSAQLMSGDQVKFEAMPKHGQVTVVLSGPGGR